MAMDSGDAGEAGWDADMYYPPSEDDEDAYDFAAEFPEDVQLAADADPDATGPPGAAPARPAKADVPSSQPPPPPPLPIQAADSAAIDKMLSEETSVSHVFASTVTGVGSHTGGALTKTASDLQRQLGTSFERQRSRMVLSVLRVTGPLPPPGESLTGGVLPRGKDGTPPTDDERDYWNELPLGGWNKCLFVWNRPYFARVRMVGSAFTWTLRIPVILGIVAQALSGGFLLSTAGIGSIISAVPLIMGFVVLGKNIVKNGTMLFPRIVEVVVIFWALWGVNKLLKFCLDRLQTAAVIPRRTANLMLNASELVLLVIAAIVVLTAVGLQVSNWIMPASIAIAYCFRDVGQNFAAGMFLFASQPFKNGDRVAIPFTNAALTSLASGGSLALSSLPPNPQAELLGAGGAGGAGGSPPTQAAAAAAAADDGKDVNGNKRKAIGPTAMFGNLARGGGKDGGGGKDAAAKDSKGDAHATPEEDPDSTAIAPPRHAAVPAPDAELSPLPRGWLEGICEAVDLRYTVLRQGRRRVMVPNNAFISREFMVVEPLVEPFDYDLDDEDARFPDSESDRRKRKPESLRTYDEEDLALPRRGRVAKRPRRKKGGTQKITMGDKLANVAKAQEKEMQRAKQAADRLRQARTDKPNKIRGLFDRRDDDAK